MTELTLSRSERIPWRALAGPAVAGASLALAVDLAAISYWALALPGLIVVVSGLMLPALFIASTLLGEPTEVAGLARSAAGALDDAGIVLLGLSPALAFLVVSTGNELTLELGTLVVAGAAVLALRSLFVRQFQMGRPLAGVPSATVLAYVIWAFVALGIGGGWFVDRLSATVGGLP